MSPGAQLIDTKENELAAGTPVDLSELEEMLVGEPDASGSLIPVLRMVQKDHGYLPTEALQIVARAARMPLSRVYGVVTFYPEFSLTPRGRHTIQVCRGAACQACGSKSALATAKHVLGVEDGQTTDDMEFTLESVACLGMCALAPVVLVDGMPHGKVGVERMEQIVAQLREA